MRYKSVRIEFSGWGHDDFLDFVSFFSDIPNGSDVEHEPQVPDHRVRCDTPRRFITKTAQNYLPANVRQDDLFPL